MANTGEIMMADNSNRNRATLATLAVIVFAMVGLSFASVPLYRLFCQVTGFGGTTQVAEAAPEQSFVLPPVQVRFDANVNPKLAWKFEPVTAPVSLVPGEEITVMYRATNLADVPTSGTATFNVTPQKAGPYFMKIDLLICLYPFSWIQISELTKIQRMWMRLSYLTHSLPILVKAILCPAWDRGGKHEGDQNEWSSKTSLPSGRT